MPVPAHEPANLSPRLGWGTHPALLLIDVCSAYYTPGCNLSLLQNANAVAAPSSMERLLAAARKGDIPVIWAQVRYTHPSMLDAGIQIKKSKTITAYYEKDPRGYNLWLPGLLPDPEDTVIYKRNPSCFFGTTLPSDLHLMGIDTLVICGVSTSGCVRATAVDAICHGYRPMVVGSACGDRVDIVQKATLDDIDLNFGDVVTEAEAVHALQAGWP